MAKRTKTAVHFLIEDGFLVRGTQDPQAALALAVAEPQFEERYWAADAVRYDPDNPTPHRKHDVVELGDLLHGLLAGARPGLFRINPARPDDMDGIRWWLGRCDTPGRGVFQGVEFQ
jgi:hypothetical protein